MLKILPIMPSHTAKKFTQIMLCISFHILLTLFYFYRCAYLWSKVSHYTQCFRKPIMLKSMLAHYEKGYQLITRASFTCTIFTTERNKESSVHFHMRIVFTTVPWKTAFQIKFDLLLMLSTYCLYITPSHCDYISGWYHIKKSSLPILQLKRPFCKISAISILFPLLYKFGICYRILENHPNGCI